MPIPGGSGGTAQQVATGLGGLAGPLGALGGSIIGGLFGRSGQNSANEANLAIARENRAWQERMSNTAMQRSAKDMEAAGLNRILAIGQPATTPAGNIATMQNKEAKLQEGIQTGITAGISAKLMQANIANINARTELTKAQRRVLGPPSQIGGGIEDALTGAKQGWIRNWNNDSGVLGTLESKMTSGFRSAKQWALDKNKEIQDNSTKRFNERKKNDPRRMIIDHVKGMDMNTKGWSDDTLYKWAVDNPERLERHLKRKRKNR